MNSFVKRLVKYRGGCTSASSQCLSPLRTGLSAISFKKEEINNMNNRRMNTNEVGENKPPFSVLSLPSFLTGCHFPAGRDAKYPCLKKVSSTKIGIFMKPLFLLWMFVFIISGQSWGNNITVTNRGYLYTMNSGMISSMIRSVTAPNLTNITAGTATFRDKKAVGYLQLGIDPDAFYCYDTTYMKIEVIFGVTYTKLNSWPCGGSGTTSSVTPAPVTLTIDFDPVNRQIYTEKARLLYDAAYTMQASVATVTVYNRSGGVIFSGTGFSSLPKDLYWETGIQLERYDNFAYTSYPANFTVALDNTTNEVVFNWTTMTGAEYFEIEYSYVNDYSATNLSTQLGATAITTTFRNNASRIRVNNTGPTTYRIPNIFERGFVLARIRGIGVKSSGSCDLDHEIPGYWSFEQTPSTPFYLSTMPTTQYVAVTRHEGTTGDNKNWKASISFAEDGKHKEIVEYADGSSRVRQSVTKLSTTNEAIVGETVYDHQGRPVVQILPVPVASVFLKYYENFNKENGTSAKFSKVHFDTDNFFGSGCIPPAPQLSTTSGAAYYYSTANSYQSDQQAFVADAEKYPYTQVVYTPDNTGRIKMQSGVGAAHILGSGHETKYYYGKPSQPELDRLFGNNVGYKSHYQKNMVMDANGQISISFLDMAGKTIATALAGQPSANTDALINPDNPAQALYLAAAETLTVDLLGDVTANFPNGEDNHLNADGTVWSNTTPLLVETQQTYHFSYDVALKDYLDECLDSACFDCVYDLEITVLDACNQPKSGFPFTMHFGGADPDTMCNATNTFSANGSTYSQFDVLLPVGNYTIEKKLKLNENVIGYYTQKYIENNTCILERDDFFQMPDTSGCFYNCEDCLEALGPETTYVATMQAQFPGMTEAELHSLYASKKAACDKICEDDGNDMCQAGYRMMLKDMTPNEGQYAIFDRDAFNHIIPPVNEKLSIFAVGHLLPDYANISSPTYEFQHNLTKSDAWRYPHFFDKNDPTNITGSPNYELLANEKYVEENGDDAVVILDLAYGGVYIPAVVPGAPVNVNGLGQYYTYPQYLANMEDFINLFNESWARSLLVYHPEFLFYKECLKASAPEVTIGSETYNTWEFDRLLEGLTFTSAATVMPTTYTNTFDFKESDPFFTNFGGVDYITGFTTLDPNAEYGAKADQLVVLSPYNVNIHEAAYGSTQCSGISNPGFMLADCPAFSTLLGSSANNAAYITSQPVWDMAVGFHLALKQEVFWKHIQFRVYEQLGLDITNHCIGNQLYDVNSDMNSLNPWLPCDLVEYYRYANKEVRFGNPSNIYNNGAFNPAPPTPAQLLAYGQNAVYEATGKCPAAIDLQTFFNELLQDGNLTASGLDIDNSNYVMLSLRDKLLVLNSPPYLPNYTGSIVGQVLNGTIGLNSFTLTLPAGYSWTDVEFLTNIDDIFLSSGTYTFTIQAQIINAPVSSWIEIQGTTNIQIAGCAGELPKICKATQEAIDLKDLMQKLKIDGVFISSSLNLGSYGAFLTTPIMDYFGDYVPGNYTWNYMGLGSYRITHGSNYIAINIPTGASTLESGTFIINSITGNIDVSPTVTITSGFIITGYGSTNDQLLGINPVDIAGTVSSSGVPAFAISECDEPLPADCQTLEHKNWFELKNFLLNQPITQPGECITHLNPSSFSGTFDIVSLEVDLTNSLDGASSNEFILTILPTGSSTPIVYTGTYCKPIRPCLECNTTEVPEPCDDLYYVLDLTEYTMDPDIIGQGATLSFSVSNDLASCYPDLAPAVFQPSTQMPGGPYTTENILDQWAIYLNSISDGSYEAIHPVGTGIIIFKLKNLSNTECHCEPSESTITQLGYFSIDNKDHNEYNQLVEKYCCDEYTPINGSGPTEPGGGDADLPWDVQPTLTLGNPCDMNLTPFDVPPPTGNPCVEALLAAANLNADNAYNNYLDSVRAAFKAAYITQCMNITEDFQVQFISTQYHFTLYYYDQAGNLVKTVPPAAVKTLTPSQMANVPVARNNTSITPVVPDHDLISNSKELLTTKYTYNTLNQPRYQKTPDGGKTEFIYDELGRLALSQNAKQAGKPNEVYSYTRYDDLGRILEVGELEATSAMLQSAALVTNTIKNYITLTNSTHTEITSTVYDIATSTSGVVQTELRNRVSYTTYRDTYSGAVRSASYYSYDIHGNVKELWNQNNDITQTAHQIKKMVYNYDLVSGKVNMVTYQPGAQDQWIHQYSYDADNRLTSVKTSRDDVFYDRDAAYFYYKHGPLARTEYGQLNVQGVDYAYTIHGWLKAVNATNLDPAKDMGRDALVATNPHRYFGKDAFSYSLSYYNNDYKNISNNISFIGTTGFSSSSAYHLYNGNISFMQTTILDKDNKAVPLLSRYKYDQLNRITEAKYDSLINLTTNVWTENFAMDQYTNKFTYDPNGNILTQFRNGKYTNKPMDDLQYDYYAGTNQLSRVRDNVSSSYTDDLDTQGPNNYDYDDIGNLIQDIAEDIPLNGIEWTVYGKVKKVNRTSGSLKDKLEFTYGPGGQRLTKKVTNAGGTITTYYYFYDASGNMMGIYKNTSTASSDLYVEEQMMYGSSRIGSVILKEKLVTPSGTPTYVQKRGQKRYELNNHLGNVLTTVSDRRKMVCSTTAFEADVISTSDYSPFGAPLPGRSLGATKCTNYSYNTTLYAINEAFGTTVNPLPIVTSPTPSTAGYFVYTTNTGGSITSGVMTFQNTNVTAATRGVGKNFSVLSGKNYTLSFKAKKGSSSGTTTYYYRVIDAATSTVIVPQTTISLTTAFVTYTASFTPSANATYRIQFYSTTASGASFQYIVDDLVISYPDVITNAVCVPTGGDYRFGFNGQEKVNEQYGEGNAYDFGARMLDVRLGKWFSTDPLSQFIASPYLSHANSPIRFIDVGGGWVPGVDNAGAIYIQAEPGDNYETLIKFFGSEKNALKYLTPGMINNTKQGVTTNIMLYFRVKNPYTTAMRDSYKHREKYVLETGEGSISMEKNAKNANYNCHSVIEGVIGAEFHNDKAMDENERNRLIRDYGEEVNPDAAEFGGTVITFGDSHSAVFFGKSSDGSAYAFTKDGPNSPPLIMKVMDITGADNTNTIESKHNSYGMVGSISSDNPSKQMEYNSVGKQSNNYGQEINSYGSTNKSNGSGYYNIKKN
jgi:hypothetical protein